MLPNSHLPGKNGHRIAVAQEVPDCCPGDIPRGLTRQGVVWKMTSTETEYEVATLSVNICSGVSGCHPYVVNQGVSSTCRRVLVDPPALRLLSHRSLREQKATYGNDEYLSNAEARGDGCRYARVFTPNTAPPHTPVKMRYFPLSKYLAKIASSVTPFLR